MLTCARLASPYPPRPSSPRGRATQAPALAAARGPARRTGSLAVGGRERRGRGGEVEGLDDVVMVGVDARVAGHLHGTAGNVLGPKPWNVDQGGRGALRVDATTADADDTVRSLEHVTVARQCEGDLLVGDNEDRVQHAAEIFIAPPFFGKFYTGSHQLGVLFQFPFQTLEKSNRIHSRACESSNNLTVLQPSYFASIFFDYK